MLYRIGTVKEIDAIEEKFPREIVNKLYHCTSVLDEAYGADRDYLQSGGYSLLAENEQDLDGIKPIIDFDTHPCEWADPIGKEHLSALYLLNDNFSIVVFMPIAIAPPELLSELEDQV